LRLVGDEFEDCVVTPVPDEDKEMAVATVKTPRGEYTLAINVHQSEKCFPVRTGNRFGVAKLKGWSWFVVDGDHIRPPC
jgi:hypothetical protein